MPSPQTLTCPRLPSNPHSASFDEAPIASDKVPDMPDNWKHR